MENIGFTLKSSEASVVPLKTVLYVSEGAGSQSLNDLKTLVPLSREANRRQEITGVLTFDGRNFIQRLEGPTKAIDALMARIAMDPRHSKLRVLFDERRADRSYIGFPLTYLYDETQRGLTTELVDGKRVLSGIQIRDIFGGGGGKDLAEAGA
ncbi:MAG: BLUF domain-containing protein [Comamonadaceae bacterium]|nr:MAG: BLUF domain-containing protein [Comamonadaceae bacterium]